MAVARPEPHPVGAQGGRTRRGTLVRPPAGDEPGPPDCGPADRGAGAPEEGGTRSGRRAGPAPPPPPPRGAAGGKGPNGTGTEPEGLMGRARVLVGGGEIPQNATKMLPEPFRLAPPKCSKNGPKMLQKWSPNGLWTHF